jgi:predicted DNA-binding transcriptional regulator YafY
MPPLGKGRHFEIIRTVLAMAEERNGVPLDDASAAVGLTPDQVESLIEPVLYLGYRDDIGDVIDESRAFVVHGDRIFVNEAHWLRNLAAVPPAPLAALRLLAAGRVMEQYLAEVPAPLAAALRKLDDLLQSSVVIPVIRPPCLDICKEASQAHRTLLITYTNDSGETSDREIEPHHVMANWGKWYVHGPLVGETYSRWWRIDRIHRAELGDRRFDPPEPLDIPDLFDLSEYDRTVRLRLPEAALDNLPNPHRIDAAVDLGDGMVEATITVAGEHRLRHLLVAAGPDAVVLEPLDLDDVRRSHAASLLAAYE